MGFVPGRPSVAAHCRPVSPTRGPSGAQSAKCDPIVRVASARRGFGAPVQGAIARKPAASWIAIPA